jgi:hypothetical protein
LAKRSLPKQDMYTTKLFARNGICDGIICVELLQTHAHLYDRFYPAVMGVGRGVATWGG